MFLFCYTAKFLYLKSQVSGRTPLPPPPPPPHFKIIALLKVGASVAMVLNSPMDSGRSRGVPDPPL